MKSKLLLLGLFIFLALIFYSTGSVKFSDGTDDVNASSSSANNSSANNSSSTMQNNSPPSLNNINDSVVGESRHQILKNVLDKQLSHMKGRYYYDNCRFEAPTIN